VIKTRGFGTRAWATLVTALTIAAFLVVLTAATPAHAATTFFVNSTKDRVDNNPGNGTCYTGVNILHDDGFIELECTLRAAIQEANANAPTVDRITFNIPTTGVATISPTRALPTIRGALTINGYSQPGASVNTATTGTNAVLKIVLDGSKAGSTPSSPVDGLYVTARNTTVRGLVINNGFRAGVVFDEVTPGEAGRTLEGCFIGTDADGANPRSNGAGVIIDDGEGNVIGGTTLAARNLISGNDNDGIFLSSAANGNSVQGNLIGTNRDGGNGDNLGNFRGVYILGGSNNTVGGNGAASNTIAFNDGRHGIQVQGVSDPSSGTGNSILANSIHDNAELGIQLGAEGGTGVTPNDGDNPATPQSDPDSDTGANRLQNFPVINSATRFLDGTTDIAGRLNSTPNTDFTIRFFSSQAADESGNGEGETFLKAIQVTTNINGNRSFSFTTDRGAVSEGQFITATATRNSTGDTSEFSKARVVQGLVIGGG